MSTSSLSPRRIWLCLAKTCVLIAASTALGAGLSAAAGALEHSLGRGSGPSPLPPVDRRFADLGRDFLPELGRAYASAWDEGAKALDSGQSVAAALRSVGRSWDGARLQLFDRLIAPELSKIVPDGQPESRNSTVDRRALAGAWRGFASGLGSPDR